MSAQSACGDIPPHGLFMSGTNLMHYPRPFVRATTRKIAEPEGAPVCFDSGHMPPAMQVFSPGTWEHTCPSCGLVTVFQVSR